MRALLPPSIVIKKAWIAPMDFHATLSATHKTYRYWIYNAKRQSALMHRYADWIRHPLDVEYLNRVSSNLIGKQDFKSFQTAGTDVVSTVREIYSAKWKVRNTHLIEFKITGNGFLKQMVRNIVGCQLMMQRKGLDPDAIRDIISARDRTKSGQTAPARGLYLWKVYYPENILIRCTELDKR
jgi:tRNA pseudouridine38-40 synthase